MAYQETTKIANSENGVINPGTSEELQLIKTILQLLKPLANISSATNKISVDVLNTLTTSISGTPNVTVTNASLATSISTVGGLGAFESQYLGGRVAYANAVRANITF